MTTPNDWHKQIVKQGTDNQIDNATKHQYHYKEFFQKLVDTMREDHAFTNAKIANGNNIQRFAAGADGCYYAVQFATGDIVKVYLYLGTTAYRQDIYACILEHKETIEQDLNTMLYWRQPNYGSVSYQIGTVRTGSIFDDQDTLDEIYHWTVHQLLSFKRTFGPHIQNALLNARRYSQYSALHPSERVVLGEYLR